MILSLSVSLLSIYFATTIKRERERERERERKGQSKKFKKEKEKKIHGPIETRSFVQRTKINVRCRENSKEVFSSRKSRVGSWKKNKEKYQARKNVRWRGFLRSLSWRRMTISSSPSRADLIAFLLLHLQFRGNKLEN